MLKIIASIVLMTAASTFGVEEINGAFGFKLGQVLPESYGQGLVDESGVRRIPVEPRDKAGFTGFYVRVMPKSREVYEICAYKSIDSFAQGEEEQTVLLAYLETKYGQAVVPGFFDALASDRRIVQSRDNGCREITINIDGMIDTYLVLTYRDTWMENRAAQQRVELGVQQLESRGL